MAKPDDMPGISEETVDMLEGQVKKGKARKFFLIYKGASIKTLVVFKKGPFGPKIMKAKKDGFKGDVAYGVVTGSGQNLVFQLPGTGEVAAAMKVDSWEAEPPTKRAKLREFLVDNGLKFKPTYEVVTELANAPDPDAESDIPVPPPPPGSEATDENEGGSEQPEAPPSPDAAALSFMERLKALKPDMAKVIAGGVSVSQDVKLRASEAAVFARKKDFAAAIEVLNDVEELTNKGLAEMSAGASGNDEAQASAFKSRLQSLLPQLKVAIGTPAGDEAKLRASEAQVFSRKNDFAQANVLLEQVEGLLKAPVSDTVGETGDNKAQQFAQQRDALEPRFLEAKRADPDKATKLAGVWDYADAQAQDENFDNAFKAIQRLAGAVEKILDASAKTDTEQPSTEDDGTFVKLQTSRLQWDQARKKVTAELRTLEQTILDGCKAINDDPEEEFDVDLSDLAGKTKQLYSVMDKLDERLLDKLDEALNADEKELRDQKQQEAIDIIKDYQVIVNEDPQVTAIDDNGFLTTSIKQTFATVLSDLASKL
jgi:hypothetical protein